MTDRIRLEQGLYQSQQEHDACGIGMVVNIHGSKSHSLVSQALTVLENMRHRGAEGADKKTGDGAGILLQIPHEFILLQGIAVPERGRYGTGLIFMPKDKERRTRLIALIEEEIERAGMQITNWRDVPVDSSQLGETALETEPQIVQIFVVPKDDIWGDELERQLFLVRKKIERRTNDTDFYIVSLSSKHIVYKGMLSSLQLRLYFKDLENPYFTSGLALVHSRFSTNTFPRWSLAQPFRLLAHNGEINTIRGNRAWMAARENVLSSQLLGKTKDIAPIIQPNMSDSASLDNVLEFLVMSGQSLPQAMSILIPESFNDRNPISQKLKDFYEYYSILMEPWDGPAALIFSDGRFAGGMLDRNGLRPARYTITTDGLMTVASEVGVMDIDPSKVAQKGRLQPGKIILVDTEEGKIYYDGELKEQLANEHPYGTWLSTNRIQLEKLRSGRKVDNTVPHFDAQIKGFGFGQEDIDRTIIPMCVNGVEPSAAMGNDTPLAVLSDRPQIFFNYFRQQFAQVTNPAIDPIREELVMSLTEYIGAVGSNILHPNEDNCKMVRLPYPILTNTQLDLLCNIRYKGFNSIKLPITFEISKGESGLSEALLDLCHKAEESVEQGYNYIILSDRFVDKTHAAIPSLLAVSAVHHYLIAVGKRVQTALIVESGEIKETMHAALLLGYGASAINPYMVFAIIDKLVKEGKVQENYDTAEKNYIKAICKGFYKIMSKMGISTIRSYRGAKLFESIGLSEELLHRYFGTEVSTIGGIDLKQICDDAIAFHDMAFQTNKTSQEENQLLPNYGRFSYRKDGIRHAWTPEVIANLQLSTRTGNYQLFKQYTSLVDQKEKPIFIRDMMDFKRATTPISVDEVEPVETIVHRFVAAAMSFGALSKEAHETIALALNRLGSRSNTGEGGEDSERFKEKINGISVNSKIKQVASGRFGVTTEYLVNAEEIQIKVAQGAKPGEGGQLPGFKVNEIIAKTRHSIPGISLISPPPHHDIYSIEDLAQLIFDLKNVNPEAAISVKLVAESGVGTIAAGVAKAKADLIVISGAEGGTGASPMSSTQYAGISPEIGLAETQQTLVTNGLRTRVRLQVDGQLKTGRDIIMMGLLGADEFAFGTLVLIVLGCVMMRKCNTNMCPMGVATQDPQLRKYFIGKDEYLVNYFTFLATEVREYLAEMGFTKFEDIIGRTDLIVKKTTSNEKYSTLDFTRLLMKNDSIVDLHYDGRPYQQTGIVMDDKIYADCAESIEHRTVTHEEYLIKNTDRAVGTKISGLIEKRFGHDYLPDSTININFKGSAGQSFGAFLSSGINLRLEGEANDYFGKGLSGGRIAIMPPRRSNFKAEDNIIAGNTGIYGATRGELYVNGQVGERFAVRNSGAIAVIEGAGDHCCEYMTGGRVVVLGKTGSNFAAGMSGGIAYVWDPEGNFDYFCNMEMVELNLVEDSTSRNELRELIHNHWTYTDSALARKMLDDWQHYVQEFIQVVPIEYKKVMQEEKDKKLRERISSIWKEF